MKKFCVTMISLSLLILVYLCLLPTEVSAATSGCYTYTVSNGEATITGCDTSVSGSVAIPSALDGYPVTGIGDYAFNSCTSLTGVTIPDGVTSIGDFAFFRCSSLTDVTIPDSVTSIGDVPFAWCYKLKYNVYDNAKYLGNSKNPCIILVESINDSITSCQIHTNTKFIYPGALQHCSSLTSVTIPNGVTSIGASAFSSCTSLTNVTIPDGVTSIGDSAFYNCSSLTSVSIPDSVTSMGNGVFYDCNKLKYIVYDNAKYLGNSTNPCILLLESINDSITSCQIHTNTKFIGSEAFADCTKLTGITIPDSVTGIGQLAFYNCSSLTDIALPNSVKSIGSSVFSECSSLTSVSIPDSMTSISDSAFSYCSSLTSVTIPDSVTSIDDSAFYYCSSLTNVTIPASVKSLKPCVFGNCTSLTEIIFKGNAPEFDWGIFTDVTANAYYPAGNDTWTESVMDDYSGTIKWIPYDTAASGYGICGDNVTWCLDATGKLTISGTGAMYDYTFQETPWFEYVDSVKTIIVENGVTGIGDYAFSECINATAVTIADSVTSIGDAGFYACMSMPCITIPDSVTSIGDSAFGYCESITSFVIPDGVTSLRATFYNCINLKTVTIPDSVTSIGDYTFRECGSLQSITIPAGVTSIDDRAFADCSGLTMVVFKGDAPSEISSESVFENVTAEAYYPEENTTWTESVMQNYGGNITWIAYAETEDPLPAPTEPEATDPEETQPENTEPEVSEPEAVEDKTVEEWNIALDDNLIVRFYLKADTPQTTIVSVTVGDSTDVCSISDLEKDGKGRYIISLNMAAAQMTDSITVQITDSTENTETAVYTVRQYCDTILSDEDHSEYHALVKEMLHYGAMAQVYFDYNAENLANDGITGAAAQAIPETLDAMTVSDKISGLDLYGASLLHRDRIAVRFYFTGDVTGCSFTADGNAYTPAAKDGMYYVEIPDILPQNLDQQITLTVTDANGKTLSVTYSPMNYIVRMNEKGTDTLKNLLKALYNYHLAAKAL